MIKRFFYGPMQSVRAVLLAISASLMALPAYATSGATTGLVGQVLVTGSVGGAPGALDFRVYLGTSPSFATVCNGQNFAYVNTSDSDYQAIVANILAARTSGTQVTVNWTQEGSYCEIAYITW